MLAYNPKQPGTIRSIQQRWLFDQWIKACKGARMPRWGALGIADIASCFDYVSLMQIEPRGAARRFFVIAHGRKLEEMHGRSLAGTYMEDTLSESIRERVLDVYTEAVESAVPVYTIAKSTDARGQEIWHERLILPFGETQLTHVMAMLEPYSENGAIERRNMLVHAAPPAYVMKAVIDFAGYQPQR